MLPLLFAKNLDFFDFKKMTNFVLAQKVAAKAYFWTIFFPGSQIVRGSFFRAQKPQIVNFFDLFEPFGREKFQNFRRAETPLWNLPFRGARTCQNLFFHYCLAF